MIRSRKNAPAVITTVPKRRRFRRTRAVIRVTFSVIVFLVTFVLTITIGSFFLGRKH